MWSGQSKSQIYTSEHLIKEVYDIWELLKLIYIKSSSIAKQTFKMEGIPYPCSKCAANNNDFNKSRACICFISSQNQTGTFSAHARIQLLSLATSD